MRRACACLSCVASSAYGFLVFLTVTRTGIPCNPKSSRNCDIKNRTYDSGKFSGEVEKKIQKLGGLVWVCFTKRIFVGRPFMRGGGVMRVHSFSHRLSLNVPTLNVHRSNCLTTLGKMASKFCLVFAEMGMSGTPRTDGKTCFTTKSRPAMTSD